jgi:competence protein ComEC
MNLKRASLRRLIIVALFVVAILSTYAVRAQETDGLLTIAFLDVGQGDAIYIKSPTGADMLIDGGPPNGAVLSVLSEVMSPTDRHLDVVLATHPDADHIGGLPDVFQRFDVDNFIATENHSGTDIENSLRVEVASEGCTTTIARRGSSIDLGGGAVLMILFPDRPASSFESNDSSIVSLLTYGSTTVLLTGDSPSGVEKYLVREDGKRLDVAILKVGHHGSDTSTSDELLSMTTPSYAVVSVGRGNAYKHPRESVLSRIVKGGSCVVRTDEAGTIIFRSDGNYSMTETPCSLVLGPLSARE